MDIYDTDALNNAVAHTHQSNQPPVLEGVGIEAIIAVLVVGYIILFGGRGKNG